MTLTGDVDAEVLDPARLGAELPALVPRPSAGRDPGEEEPGGGDGTLRSVSIAMAVLDCFVAEPELGPTRVAQRLGVAKSTACRMLAALASGGMLERSRSGRYRLGLRMFEMGQMAVDRLMLRDVALPVLGELREILRETAQLAVPVGADVLYVDRLESTGAGTMFHTEMYRRGAGHSSSAGKAMAAVNTQMARAIVERGFERRTPFTIVDPGRYAQVLRQVRADGFAASRDEHTMGMSSIAAPVLLTRGDRQVSVAAISVVGPTPRVLGPRKVAVVQAVRRAAATVSATLERSQQP